MANLSGTPAGLWDVVTGTAHLWSGVSLSFRGFTAEERAGCTAVLPPVRCRHPPCPCQPLTLPSLQPVLQRVFQSLGFKLLAEP